MFQQRGRMVASKSCFPPSEWLSNPTPSAPEVNRATARGRNFGFIARRETPFRALSCTIKSAQRLFSSLPFRGCDFLLLFSFFLIKKRKKNRERKEKKKRNLVISREIFIEKWVCRYRCRERLVESVDGTDEIYTWYFEVTRNSC